MTGAGLQDYGFTGREYDSETGLYFYRARHYDPGPGRFLQSDPLGFAGGDLNLYAYTWNDPSNWTDPSGLSPEGDVTYEAALVMMYQHEAVAVVGAGAVCTADRISTALYDMGNLLAEGRPVYEAELEPAASCATQAVATAIASRLIVPRSSNCGCRQRRPRTGKNSFPAGTAVLTPDGSVAIETVREGGLIIARNEETGQSGLFPVTGVSARQATDMIWLTLESGNGVIARMAVTSAHPLFIVGKGWEFANQLQPGDAIRDKYLAELRILAVEFDDSPQLAFNLEIAGAHTYFAGELEAWGHNGGTSKVPTIPPSQRAKPRCASKGFLDLVLQAYPTCVYCKSAPSTRADHVLSHSHGGGTSIDNLVGACNCCNLDKSNKTLWELLGRPSRRR